MAPASWNLFRISQWQDVTRSKSWDYPPGGLRTLWLCLYHPRPFVVGARNGPRKLVRTVWSLDIGVPSRPYHRHPQWPRAITAVPPGLGRYSGNDRSGSWPVTCRVNMTSAWLSGEGAEIASRVGRPMRHEPADASVVAPILRFMLLPVGLICLNPIAVKIHVAKRRKEQEEEKKKKRDPPHLPTENVPCYVLIAGQRFGVSTRSNGASA